MVGANLRLGWLRRAKNTPRRKNGGARTDLPEGARIGLVCAALSKFGPTRGYKFSTTPMVGFAGDHPGDAERAARSVPIHNTERSTSSEKVQRELSQELGRPRA